MIYLKIIYFNTFDAFGLNLRHIFFMPSCLAWNIPEPKETHVRISSKIMFLWWVKLLTPYEVGIYPLLPSCRTRIPPGFNCWTSVALVFQYWSCCWVLIWFHLSVESWFICCCFDSLMSRSPSREPNNYYVYEPQQNLGRGLHQHEK